LRKKNWPGPGFMYVKTGPTAGPNLRPGHVLYTAPKILRKANLNMA
jgi:hypothetical protein